MGEPIRIIIFYARINMAGRFDVYVRINGDVPCETFEAFSGSTICIPTVKILSRKTQELFFGYSRTLIRFDILCF